MSATNLRQCKFCRQDFIATPGCHSLCSLLCRFSMKVNENGPVPAHCPELGPCHVWTGSRGRHGYGNIGIGDKTQLAHRVAWFLATGQWPTQQVLHACDGGPIGCVRFAHLFEGTPADNATDRVMKGRSRPRRGSAHGRSKLTEALVRGIIAAHSNGETIALLAERFSVAQNTILGIVRRRTWKHLGLAATCLR